MMRGAFDRASQFSRYLLSNIGIVEMDKNVRAGDVKLSTFNRFRTFLAVLEERELRWPVLSTGRWPVLSSWCYGHLGVALTSSEATFPRAA
jgi:hypothetical protein